MSKNKGGDVSQWKDEEAAILKQFDDDNRYAVEEGRRIIESYNSALSKGYLALESFQDVDEFDCHACKAFCSRRELPPHRYAQCLQLGKCIDCLEKFFEHLV